MHRRRDGEISMAFPIGILLAKSAKKTAINICFMQ
jgi:hypothetical protein